MTEKKKRNVILTLLPVLLMVCVIFCLSAQTAERSVRTSGVLTELVGAVLGMKSEEQLTALDGGIRQLAHFTEFGSFGFFLQLHLLAWQRLKGKTRGNGLPLSLLIGVLYAVSDEIHQMFVPGRSAQGIDILADSLGVLVGNLLLLALAGRFSKQTQKKRGAP